MLGAWKAHFLNATSIPVGVQVLQHTQKSSSSFPYTFLALFQSPLSSVSPGLEYKSSYVFPTPNITLTVAPNTQDQAEIL